MMATPSTSVLAGDCRITPCILLAVATVVLVSPSAACRYNVRDVGFVDLDRSTYWVRLGSAELKGATNLSWDSFRAVFSNGNVRIAQEPSRLERELTTILVAPDDRTRIVSRGDGNALTTNSLQTACVSELSQRMVDRLIDCHSIALLIEGTSTTANIDARNVIDDAIEQVLATRSLWPKPIENPPEVVTIRQSDRPLEETLLWSMGVEDDAQTPQVVVLFGRGRSLGPVLSHSDIESGLLVKRLNIISIDCECDFNVGALIGPMIPHRWTDEHEARATKSLGFDPGLPLVKVEVEQILARWPGGNSSERTEQAFGDPLLGYQEIELPSGDSESLEQDEDNTRKIGSRSSEMSAQIDPPLDTTDYTSGLEVDTKATTSEAWWYVWWAIGGVVLLSLVGSGFILLNNK